MNEAIRNRKMWWSLLPLAAVIVAVSIGAPKLAASGDEEEEHSEVHQIMEQINDHYKILRRNARRQRFDDVLSRIVEMQSLSLQAMHVDTIPLAEEAAGNEEKQRLMIGFKKMQAQLITTLMDLEIAVLEGRDDDASDLVQKLAQLKQDGHDKFTDLNE